jgi:serine/threonine-protein kinase
MAAVAAIKDTSPSPAPTPVSTPAVRSSGNGAVWALLLVAIVGGGGYGVLKLTSSLDATVPEEPVVQPETASLKDFKGPQLPVFREPGTAMPDAGVAKAGPTNTAAPTKEPDDAQEEPRVAARGAQGKLTLVVLPEAEVYRGKKRLGRTPLFNVAMPVGTHVLRIVGPDKKPRVLSVPVESGKTAVFKLALQNIPEG